MTTTLPTCCHRGPEQHPGNYICTSNRIIHSRPPGVASIEACLRCPYADKPNRVEQPRNGKPIATEQISTGGPGTELKKLLGKMGINPKGPCECEQQAIMMDQRGPDWCEKNIEKIVDVMKKEARRRRLPFVPAGARLLIRRAIRNSRRSSQE